MSARQLPVGMSRLFAAQARPQPHRAALLALRSIPKGGAQRICSKLGHALAIARPTLRSRTHVAPPVLERVLAVEEVEQLPSSSFAAQQQQPDGRLPTADAEQHAAAVDALRASLDASTSDLGSVSISSMVSLDLDHEGEPAGFQLPQAVMDIVNRMPARTRGLILLNLLVLLVATNWVVVKQTGTEFDPFYFAALRFGVAAAALSPFALRAARHPRILRAGVELGLLTAAGYLTQSLGLLTTDASRASFLSTFTVLVVPILVGLSGRGVKPAIWACAGAAVVGVSLLEQSGAAPSVGDAWAVASAFAFGVQIFRTEHWSRKISSQATVHLMSIVLAVTAAVAAAAAVVAHPADALHVLSAPGDLATALTSDAVPWNAVLYTGLLSTDVALLMELVALRDVASSEAAIIYTLEPVLGAGIAFAVLGERWGPLGWAGAGLIISSSVFTQVFVREEGEAATDAEMSASDKEE